MNELRKMKKAVNKYVKLLATNPDILRNNCKYYLSDVNRLQDLLALYEKYSCDNLQSWCNASVDVFSLVESNIFLKLKKIVLMQIVNYNLNKISYNLAVSGILGKNLDFIKVRLSQFEYFT